MKATQKELDEAVGEIVDRIMERGRLSQLEREGKIGVKDGGISLRRIQFINELKQFAKTEAVALAERLIGEDRKVRVSFTDISDDEPVANPADTAILAFQNSQKEILEHYQNPQLTPVTHYQEETLIARSSGVNDKPLCGVAECENEGTIEDFVDGDRFKIIVCKEHYDEKHQE